jgi:hypothetical protein
MTNQNKKSRPIYSATIMICVISGMILGGIGISSIIYPRVATVFYHFDYQYRAGFSEVEEHTITEALFNILDIFDQHPNWNLSIEIESFVIQLLYENYSSIYQMVKRMVDRGQLELCLIEYSEMLGHAFPWSDYNNSAYYSEQIGNKFNINHGQAVLLQEGQWYPSFFLLKQYGYKYFMADAAKFLYFGYNPTAPLYSWDLNTYPLFKSFSPTILNEYDPIYVVNYKHIPVYEAGVYHTWLWTQDAEIQLDDAKPKQPNQEFQIDPQLKEQYEARLCKLEQLGTRFMTVSQWAQFCIEKNTVQPLMQYIPETHWSPQDYRSCWRWMGNNQGHTDDGAMLALLYRTRNQILAVEQLLSNSTPFLSTTEYISLRNLLDTAWKHHLLSEGTDVMGLDPRAYERDYGLNHTQKAVELLNQILISLKGKNTWFTTQSTIYANIKTNELISSINLQSDLLVNVIQENLSFSDLPFNISISTITPSQFVNSSISLCKYFGIQYWNVQLGFNGSMDWEKGLGSIIIHLPWNASNMCYSPSMLEYGVVNLSRSMYPEKNDVFLPLANGFFYADGKAFMKNCSAYHTAVNWKADSFEFEDSKLHFYANYQFFFLEAGISLERALNFANSINTSPIIEIKEEFF